MTAKSMRRMFAVAALLLSTLFVVDANASCCGGGTTAFYPTTAYTAYSPVAAPVYRTGWYPGYWWNRIGARLWGSPSTYVAAYPTTFAAPTYTAAYAPAYSAGYAASYAAPVAGCSSCASYSASYAPAPCSTCASPCTSCTTACSPCSACTTCAAPAVTQAVYQQPAIQPAPGCATCGTTVVQPGAIVTSTPVPDVAVPMPESSATPTPAPQSTFNGQNGAPSLPQEADVPAQREEQKPPTNGTSVTPVQPEPGTDSNGTDPYDVNGANGDNSTYFQAPKLFDPNDRTAQRSITPVRTAVYEQPVSYYGISAQRATAITEQQAVADAAGWVSASK